MLLLLLLPANPGIEFFEKRIRPLFHEQCLSCHGSDPKKVRGGLRLDSPAGLRKGGDSGPLAATLLKAVRHEDGVKPMPPKGKLQPSQFADLEAWAKLGFPVPKDDGSATVAAIDWAKARSHWSFQPVKRLPGSIDSFITARLDGLAPVAEADKPTLLRRLSFHLAGLPPTPADADAFLADARPDAYERLVDRLLSSPAFGERQARHWLDVARYAEDQAHTFAVKPSTFAWRYRDWVVQAFNADLPYDRFVKLQIAADLMEGATKEDKSALGFFGLGAQYYKNTDAARAAADELDDRVDTFARGFLGLTVSCARCHDHKFDPIPTQDYYSIAGVFHSSRLADLPMA
ncbi:MAG: DUF1549 domain-containing protein, partial [Gemmataceae bacterium]|nr:DUF1549 domain-containing protein [Gemmataceae bacterium]